MTRGSIICMLVAASMLWACKPDFIELDLSKSAVTLISPTDNLQTSTLTHTFWWYEVEGAMGYELQVVSPSFTSPATLVLDSTTISDQYTLALSPGEYEWQVRAYNASSTTAFTTYALTIDSTTNIAAQVMVLTAPANNLVANEMSMTFRWDTLYNADDYRFELATPDFNGTQVISPLTITGDSTVHVFTAEGTYEWRVRGQNQFSSTAYTTHALEIDTTRPNTPVLVAPANNALYPDTSNTLFWDRGVVTGSTIMDSLYIYADTNMTTLVQGVYTSNTSYTDSLGPGAFYWRVISIDAANNRSDYSALRKFTIQ